VLLHSKENQTIVSMLEDLEHLDYLRVFLLAGEITDKGNSGDVQVALSVLLTFALPALVNILSGVFI
jgi:hypothetical protein